MRIVGCFLEFDNKFVILLRQSYKPEGNTWGLPSGKVEIGENDKDAIIRELKEETGYKANPLEVEHIGDYEFVSSNGTPYTYIAYKVKLKSLHNVVLEKAAHTEFKWVTSQECYARSDLIPGLHKLLNLVRYIG